MKIICSNPWKLLVLTKLFAERVQRVVWAMQVCLSAKVSLVVRWHCKSAQNGASLPESQFLSEDRPHPLGSAIRSWLTKCKSSWRSLSFIRALRSRDAPLGGQLGFCTWETAFGENDFSETYKKWVRAKLFSGEKLHSVSWPLHWWNISINHSLSLSLGVLQSQRLLLYNAHWFLPGIQ